MTSPIRREALSALSAHLAKGNPAPLFVVVEKILGEDEPLPHDWRVDGTSGYDFLNACNRLFVHEQSVAALERLYHELTAETRSLGTLVRDCKQIIMQTSMASEIITLSHQLDRITERNRRYRDFTLSNLRHALREFIASLAIYRSYTTPDARVSDRDRHFIELACEQAKLVNQRVSEGIFDFIRDTVLLSNLDQFPLGDRPRILDWVLRFQQVTGPIMAKGIEDTAFYVYNKLVSLNEVGGHPDRCESTLEAFHNLNAENAQYWPCTMLCSSTHDTKRSEDVRLGSTCFLSSSTTGPNRSPSGSSSPGNTSHKSTGNPLPAPTIATSCFRPCWAPGLTPPRLLRKSLRSIAIAYLPIWRKP